jgi:curli production assembly/transport component CsgG|tara:strand:+ start:821 stop:1735 length:915 start_codon:yes stop_codon:yes gene_type:complete
MEYFGIVLLSFMLGACSMQNTKNIEVEMPFVQGTPTKTLLHDMPKLVGVPTDGVGNPVKITVAVYEFPDVTGQRKQVGLSTAVSQGADVWVIQALMAVNNGGWFTVVERASLDSLVKERQLIRSTRELYDGTGSSDALQPMMFAGLILEGGIVGYDSNITSGGAGARFLGLGANEQYRTDQVTVSMRLVAVQTGEVLLTVSSTKTIASTSNGADVFRFLDLGTRAVEIESGNAANEPVNYAIRTAIEYGVLQMLYEGKEKGLWEWEQATEEVVQNIDAIKLVDSWIPVVHPNTEKLGEVKEKGE